MAFRTIHTPATTHPHGHYSQAIVYNGTVYVSGVLGNSEDQHVRAERSIEDQARNCFDQMGIILAAASSDMAHVLKLNVFVARIDLWPRVNTICEAVFKDHRPARIVVPCDEMRLGSLIEMDAVAAVID